MGLYQDFSDNEQLSLHVQKLVADAIDRHSEQGSASGHQYTLLTGSGAQGTPVISKAFFDETLNSLDEDLTNGVRMRLTLEDVWVDPELQRLSSFVEGGGRKRRHYDVKNLTSDIKEGKSLVLFGGEKSGKTSLCRTMFVRLYAEGFLPVFLQGDRINNPDALRLMQRVRSAYAAQYENLSSAVASNIPKEKIVLIIDDFDRARLASKRAIALLASIADHCHAAIVCSSPIFAISVLELEEDAASLDAMERIEIKDVGHRNRYQLIEHWCLAGHVQAIDDEHLRAQVEGKRRVINQILGANLVPRTPIIVLILLQAIDVGQVGDLARTGYVRYYKFLIDAAILRAASREEAEIAYALLPEMAWAMYQAQSNSLKSGDAERVIDELAARRALRKTTLYNVLTGLRRMGMFEEHGDSHRFKHRYVYYFFLADHISRHLGTTAMDQEVERLCRDISARENSNILIFLSFFSNSEIIIRNLTMGLYSCFKNANQFEFNQHDNGPINRLINVLPKEVVNRAHFAKNRGQRLEAEDRTQESERAREADESARRKDGAMPEYRVAFTAIEVLGHILRNHYARLDAGPKVEIFQAGVDAALRYLGATLEHLSQSLDSLIAIIRTFTDKLDTDENEKKWEATAKRVVFYIVVYFVRFVIRRIVQAVGHESLEITYQEAGQKLPSIAGDFIRLAIKLDCFREFPIGDLRSVADSLHDNRIGMSLLRMVVRERLDMRPPGNTSELQRICNIAGLDLKPLLLARNQS